MARRIPAKDRRLRSALPAATLACLSACWSRAPEGDRQQVVAGANRTHPLDEIRVVDHLGNDVAGAEVTAWHGVSFPGEQRRQATPVVTDAGGRAWIERIGGSIEATCGDARSGAVSMPPRQHSLLVLLREPVTVRGRIVDATGRPVAGAPIAAESLTHHEVRRPHGVLISARRLPALPDPPATTADARGRFVIRLHRGGLYGLRDLSSAATAACEVLAGAAPGADVVLRHRERVRVSGVVVDGVGAPVPNARVRVRAGTDERTAAAEIDGSFTIEVDADGPIEGAATADVHEFGLGAGSIVPRATGQTEVHARLRIARVVGVRGVVRDAAGPLRATLMVRPAGDPPAAAARTWLAKTTASGEIELPRLLADQDYEAVCHCRGYAMVTHRFTARAGTRIEIVLLPAPATPAPRRVRLRAVDRATGAPLPYFEATAILVTPEQQAHGRSWHSNSDATLTLDIKEPGDLHVEVEAPGYASLVTGSLPFGSTDVIAELERPIPLRVFVTDRSGRAVPASIAAERRAPVGRPLTLSGAVDADGGCTLLVASGSWKLHATRDLDGARVQRDVEVTGPTSARIEMPD